MTASAYILINSSSLVM